MKVKIEFQQGKPDKIIPGMIIEVKGEGFLTVGDVFTDGEYVYTEGCGCCSETYKNILSWSPGISAILEPL